MERMDTTPAADAAPDQEFRALALSSKLDRLVNTILPPRFALEEVGDVRFGREGDFFRDTENTSPAQNREGFYVEIDFIEDRPISTDPRIPEDECRGIIKAYATALKGQMPDSAVISVSAQTGSANSALVIPDNFIGRRIQSYWRMNVRCFMPSDCFDEFVNPRA